jgi:hypothetical protein
MLASENRREFKFILRAGQESFIREKVAKHLTADIHARDGYTVISEYFDSCDLKSYWQKQLGSPTRRRLRGRLYSCKDGSIPPAAFIEIKHKLDGATVKRRVNCELKDLIFFSRGKIPSDLELLTRTDNRIIAEIADLIDNHNYRPVVQIRYHRYAYDSGADGTIRITFDLDLRCRFHLKPMLPNCDDFDLNLMDPGASIMEVKTIGPVPYWFRNLIGDFNLTPCSFSKYAKSIELTKLKTNSSNLESQPK